MWKTGMAIKEEESSPDSGIYSPINEPVPNCIYGQTKPLESAAPFPGLSGAENRVSAFLFSA